ncbi:hypothetical protein PG991_015921 [Apiospora marii]|uniref:Rhodopsin domain-containing protein n=1 Tax=Apiospora marii TaxID=335849 RepID=A0ABR1R100_9PEZI
MPFLFPVETGAQYLFVIWSVFFTVMATVAVGMRLLARRVADRKLGSDDILMILSLIVLLAYQVVSILAVIVGGMGFHIEDIENRFLVLPPSEIFTKYLLATQIMWCVNLTLTKASILTLYIKIFTMRPFVLVAKITILVLAPDTPFRVGKKCADPRLLSSIIMIVGSVLVCRPIAFYWDKSIKDGTCGDYPALWTANACITIATSVVTLVLPIRHVWNLQLERNSKIFLMGAFSLGFLTCIAGAVYISMIASYDPTDSTYNALPLMLVAFVEPAVGIALGCVPVMRPLFHKNGANRRHTGALRLAPDSSAVSASCLHSKNSYSSSSPALGGGGGQHELQAITVKTSWYVHHQGSDSRSFLGSRSSK